MYTYPHPRPAVTVDIVLFKEINQNFQVLLIKRGQEPFQDRYALPGGFIEIDESLEEAARRELQEETGLTVDEMTQIYTFSKPDRDPRGRVISTAFSLIIDEQPQSLQPGSDASDAIWLSLSNLPELAFDHHTIIQVAADKMGVPW